MNRKHHTTSGTIIRIDLKKNKPEYLDKVAFIVGLIAVLSTWYMLYNLTYTDSNPIHYAIGTVISFILGTLLVYSVFYGSALILYLTKRFWYVFLIAIALFIWYIKP